MKEDDIKPENRAYVLRGDVGRVLPLLGSEIESLVEWWLEEKSRVGVYEEIGSRDQFWPWQDPETGEALPEGKAEMGPYNPFP